MSVIAVLSLSLLTPPFQVPDEPAHMFRAYQLSEGRLFEPAREGVAGGEVASSLVETAEHFLGSRALHMKRVVTPTPLRETLATTGVSLEPERREFANFSNTAYYPPTAYVAQTAAIVAGRALGLGPLDLLYAARVANGVTAAIGVAAAIWLIPAGGMILCAFALLPMMVFLFGSASAEPSLFAAILLFTALSFRARARGYFTGPDLAGAAVTAVMFCIFKPVYAPLLLIALPCALRSGSRRRVLIQLAIICAVASGSTIAWLAYSSPAMAPLLPGRSPSAQARWIAANPAAFFWVIVHSVRWFGAKWAGDVVGYLGWHNVELPRFAYTLPAVAATLGLVLPRAPKPRLSSLELGWYFFLLGASAFLVLMAIYLTWTSIGNICVDGVQGRYFLPYIGVVAVILEGLLPRLSWGSSRVAIAAIAAIAAVQVALTCVVVAQAWTVL
ncbi:MAG: DUF2142 domain-containing protein [Acetobacteraceae bacterium]|nr:DUF2142 domain-containing protein [Acetobacteraceae bacterium]